jgi:hypothetical protein
MLVLFLSSRLGLGVLSELLVLGLRFELRGDISTSSKAWFVS